MPRTTASRTPFHRLCTGALAAATGLALVACEVPDTLEPCEDALVEQVDMARTMDNLRVLVDDIGPRFATSEEERRAATFIADELAELGYEVEVQEFPRTQVVASVRVRSPEGLRIDVAAGRVQQVPASEYPLLTDGPIEGRIVDCGDGDCPDEVEGQIALVRQGEADAGSLLAAAEAAGARAAILHGEGWRRHLAAVPEDEAILPFATVNEEAADEIRAAGEVEVAFEVVRNETSQNVIATRPVDGDPDAPIVVFSAHYDSVEQAPGASDNGSGTVGMMEMARLLARVETDVELRFAAVGAEEVGLVGSRYYVSTLPDEERERIVANFNTDMIGTAGEEQTQLYVNTLDGDNIVAQAARIARDRLGLPEERIRAPFQRGASDHVAFHEGGIPAANFIWRDPETADLEPWYHQPHDEVERISEERLRTAIEVVTVASQQLICAGGELREHVDAVRADLHDPEMEAGEVEGQD